MNECASVDASTWTQRHGGRAKPHGYLGTSLLSRSWQYPFERRSTMMQEHKLLKEFERVSDAKLSKSAIIHGLVASVSPMKAGKYFDAKLTNGEKHLRIVSFQGEHCTRLAEYQEGSKSVALLNCEVKKARQSEELEVILKSASRVEESLKKFKAVDISKIGNSEIALCETGLEEYFRQGFS